jgi:hypothetical protein
VEVEVVDVVGDQPVGEAHGGAHVVDHRAAGLAEGVSRAGPADVAMGKEWGQPYVCMDVNRISTRCVTLDDASSSHPLKTMSVKNATDIKQHLALLEHERVLAHDPRYMADLEQEILATRHAYVGSAVIEIAHLRAALGGENWG